MSSLPDVLAKIIRHKTEEVKHRAGRVRLNDLQAAVRDLPQPREFVRALASRIDNGQSGVIAEIKKASPSKGVIRKHFVPAEIAANYAAAGATCLSVLTDTAFFQGSDDHLGQARSACDLPVLRKDFIVDPYQVWESRAIGADCVLLIVAALDESQLSGMFDLALDLNLDVLVEVHNAAELERALRLPLSLIGVNNRDLKTFHTTLNTTLELLPAIPDDLVVITESGILSIDDVNLMRRHGVNGFLIGEACMRADDPGQKLRELFFDISAHAVVS